MAPKPGEGSSQQPAGRPGDISDPTSPASLHQIPTRDERDDELSASYQSTDTVRRHRGVTGYGTLQGSTRSLIDSDADYAEAGSSSAHDRSYARVAAASPRPHQSGSQSGSARAGSSRPKKPAMPRRTSQKALRPYPGDVFSVDDDIMEVEADAAEQQRGGPKREQQQPQVYGSRRRSVAPSSLARGQSFVTSRQEAAEPEYRDDPEPDPTETNEEDEHHSELPLEGHLDCDSDTELSDAESFTLRDRQEAINETHPFGIRLWKPALYKKSRSVQKTAEGDIHSVPGQGVSNWILFFNILWTIVFGCWLSLLAAFGAGICFIFIRAPGCRSYGRTLWGLSGYLFHPFGKVVRLEKDEAYLHEDRGEGRSVFEYEQWQNGDLEYGRLFFGPEPNRSIVGRSRRSIDSSLSEADSLLGNSRTIERTDSNEERRMKRRLFGRGDWNVGRVIFFFFFYFLIAPVLIAVSLACWFLVFTIPMGKVTMLLFSHLRRHPLALSFESGVLSYDASPHSSILLCTYRATGPRYWKYTIDGTNIFLINLMVIVFFVIFDWIVLEGILDLDIFLTSSAFLFPAGLLSIIPLAYFIGQAVASISAQSSMGLGAAINAFFATIVEVYLYCVALNQGKGQLVEGSIVGSIFAGILFLPGISMCCGAIKRKTQRFNAKSAGVTSTMLLFAVLGAFGPTLFSQFYGSHELNCTDCVDTGDTTAPGARDCRRCYFSEVPAIDDRFYIEAVRPYTYIAAGALFFMYLIGLWFTLRTHAAVIWNSELDEKKHEDSGLRQSVPQSFADTTGTDIRDSHLYKRILGQSLKQVGLSSRQDSAVATGSTTATTPHVVPPKDGNAHHAGVSIPGFSEAENHNLVRQVAEVAATAAALAARDVRHHPRRPTRTGEAKAPTSSGAAGDGARAAGAGAASKLSTFPEPAEVAEGGLPGAVPGEHAEGGGHDAPNWSRLKSTVILLGATVLYAIIAEILVDTVDVVLEGFAIDEKFLGITLFALVPNTTEFLNAISFAMNGNIALSMEIGSAYALQVCMLQIPALVFYSALHPPVPLASDPDPDPSKYMFSLLFPQWDMVTVIICLFLLSYMYGEGKSNYFKGSILLLSYLIVMVGFWFSGLPSVGGMGMRRFDKQGVEGEWISYNTIGRGRSGIAY
ncbi:related to calcium permease Vcx1p [Cephalotrichum gorgonifer]|uniref:Related to calcium permease Vcx1p n=1 Tax=Cephalotrichum gorgonifer TaxID=2041049 RepID=A0AAE8SW81_9PEZI|nr:related to calcium permease Vcx1p [Cephalotrichum gorgonifer]